MRAPSKKELLDEIRRLRAENERLSLLVQTQRPELRQLREVECAIRDIAFNTPMQLTRAHGLIAALLPPNDSDLPSLEEISGMWGGGPTRIEAALEALSDGNQVTTEVSATPQSAAPRSSSQSDTIPRPPTPQEP